MASPAYSPPPPKNSNYLPICKLQQDAASDSNNRNELQLYFSQDSLNELS